MTLLQMLHVSVENVGGEAALFAHKHLKNTEYSSCFQGESSNVGSIILFRRKITVERTE